MCLRGSRACTVGLRPDPAAVDSSPGGFAMTSRRFLRVVALACMGGMALLLADVASGAPFLPEFGAATFDPNQPIDSSYFPMTGTATLRYTASEHGQPIDSYFEHTNTGPGPVIAGIQSYVQHDRE